MPALRNAASPTTRRCSLLSSHNRRNNQSVALSGDDRTTMLLDDLIHEIRNLTEAVEQQNELLEELLENRQDMMQDDE